MPVEKSEQRRQITEAFRAYAAHGQNPNHAEMLGSDTWLSDTAVSQTLSVLRVEGKEYIVKAVEAVYFADPTVKLEKSDISRRVIRFSVRGSLAESTVYGWLATARKLYWAIAHHNDERGAG